MKKQWGNELVLALGLAVVLLACKQEASDDTSQAEPEKAKAAKKAEPAPAPDTPAQSAVDNKAMAAADVAKFKIPDTPPSIPSTPSNPPQGSEWTAGVPINTQGANARAKNCRMLLLREWLNILCHGDVIGYEKKEDFGTLHEDYFEQIVPGKMASFVVRLKPGKNQKIRVCRSTNRASLFVSWPPSKDFPLHVALGHGPPCDGSDWGVGYGKQGGAAVKVSPDSVSPSELAAYDEMDKKIMEAARTQCAEGVEGACMYACGKSSCP